MSMQNETFIFDLLVCLVSIVAGAVTLLILGIKNDLAKVKLAQKLSMQFIAAIFFVLSGNYFNNLYGLFGLHEISAYAGIPITLFFVFFMVRAFDQMDKVDGLAGAMGLFAALTLGIMSMWEQGNPYCILAFVIAGVLTPFLIMNFLRRRKITMGSTGSLTLGYLLAFIAVNYSVNNLQIPGNIAVDPLVIIWSALFIPLFGTIRVMIKRLINRKPMFGPDRYSIHHKLIDLGYTHIETTIILTIGALVVFLFNIILIKHSVNINIILALNIGMSFLFNVDLSRQKKMESETKKTETTGMKMPEPRLDLLNTEK